MAGLASGYLTVVACPALSHKNTTVRFIAWLLSLLLLLLFTCWCVKCSHKARHVLAKGGAGQASCVSGKGAMLPLRPQWIVKMILKLSF